MQEFSTIFPTVNIPLWLGNPQRSDISNLFAARLNHIEFIVFAIFLFLPDFIFIYTIRNIEFPIEGSMWKAHLIQICVPHWKILCDYLEGLFIPFKVVYALLSWRVFIAD